MEPLPAALGPRDLPLAELMAARLDGEVYAMGAAHFPVDEVPTPELRLAAALSDRGTRYIAELGTAAWVWGATPVAPPVLEVCVDLRARARPVRPRNASVREVALRADETALLGRHRVTTPVRTAVDLARVRDAFSSADDEVIRQLATIGGFGFVECLAAMDQRRNLPAKKRAAERLARVLGC